ncbi:MAG: exosortase K [Acidobacteria bacterium]|nr:exosortase K [Acidobacteriota bacterium]
MTRGVVSRRVAQTAAVVLCAAAVKLHYSTAGAEHLRWILAPTAAAVGLFSGAHFEYEAHAGYVNGDRSFVIAPACAGVNFLITAFLLLSLSRLWWNRSREMSWRFIPCAALASYLATLAANAVRISVALSMRGLPPLVGWLSPGELHRLEGSFVYFGFLLLLFALAEKVGPEDESSPGPTAGLLRRSLFPLLVYYATTLGVPLLNGAYRRGADFWEHALFVLLTPLALALPLATLRLHRLYRDRRRVSE